MSEVFQIKQDMCQKIERFSMNHFYYINLILGDQNIRQHIMEAISQLRNVFYRKPRGRSKGWYEGKTGKTEALRLATIPSSTFDSHHLCRRGTQIVCSDTMCIQHLWRPFDTLCQSYSMMIFLGYLQESNNNINTLITFRDPLTEREFTESKLEQPSRNLQTAMANMWLKLLILDNPIIFLKTKKNEIYVDPKTGEKIPWTLREAIVFSLADTGVLQQLLESEDNTPKHIIEERDNYKSIGLRSICLELWNKIQKNSPRLDMWSNLEEVPDPEICVISKIVQILLNWRDYGWIYFLTTKYYNPCGLTIPKEGVGYSKQPKKAITDDKARLASHKTQL